MQILDSNHSLRFSMYLLLVAASNRTRIDRDNIETGSLLT